MEEETRQMRGHLRKIRKSQCVKDTKIQEVFTTETEFDEQSSISNGSEMREFKIWKEQVLKKIKDLDGNRAQTVLGHILKECKVLGHILKKCKELIDPIYDILKCSVETREVSKNGKRADILMYKGGNKN